MKRFFTLAILFFCFTACTTVRINYFGKTNTPPTTQVDLYLYEKDISTPYEVLGRAETSIPSLVSNTSDKVKNLLIAQAKQVGADAVILYDESQIPLPPTVSTSTSQNNSVNAIGDSVITTTSTTSAYAASPVFSPVFIKYKVRKKR